MKKLTILTIAASLLAGTAATTTMTSCNSKQKEQLEQERAIAEATKEELQTAVAERDQLLQLVNEISNASRTSLQSRTDLMKKAAIRAPSCRPILPPYRKHFRTAANALKPSNHSWQNQVCPLPACNRP